MQDLRTQIEYLYSENFGEATCKKFSGTLTVELIRQRLRKNGIPVSPRDVFIKGLGIEIDLLIPRPGILPAYNVIYRPEDVIAALEVKYRGAFGSQALENTKANFERIKQLDKRVQCIYVTVVETIGYKWAVTRKNLGFPAYTLYWYSNKTQEYRRSKDWEKLVDRLTQTIRNSQERA